MSAASMVANERNRSPVTYFLTGCVHKQVGNCSQHAYSTVRTYVKLPMLIRLRPELWHYNCTTTPCSVSMMKAGRFVLPHTTSSLQINCQQHQPFKFPSRLVNPLSRFTVQIPSKTILPAERLRYDHAVSLFASPHTASQSI